MPKHLCYTTRDWLTRQRFETYVHKPSVNAVRRSYEMGEIDHSRAQLELRELGMFEAEIEDVIGPF